MSRYSRALQLLPIHELNLTSKCYTRAGVLPYCSNSRGELVYWFGVDSESYQLADFGGGRDSLDDDILDTAIREYAEESFNLLPPLSRGQGYQQWALVKGNNVLILHHVRLTHPLSFYIEQAHQLAKGNLHFETQALVCLSQEQIISLLEKDFFNPHLATLIRQWRELQFAVTSTVRNEPF